MKTKNYSKFFFFQDDVFIHSFILCSFLSLSQHPSSSLVLLYTFFTSQAKQVKTKNKNSRSNEPYISVFGNINGESKYALQETHIFYTQWCSDDAPTTRSSLHNTYTHKYNYIHPQKISRKTRLPHSQT